MWVPGLVEDLMVYVFKLYVGVSVIAAAASYKPSLSERELQSNCEESCSSKLYKLLRESNLFSKLNLGLGQDGLVGVEVGVGRLRDDLLHRRRPHRAPSPPSHAQASQTTTLGKSRSQVFK